VPVSFNEKYSFVFILFYNSTSFLELSGVSEETFSQRKNNYEEENHEIGAKNGNIIEKMRFCHEYRNDGRLSTNSSS